MGVFWQIRIHELVNFMLDKSGFLVDPQARRSVDKGLRKKNMVDQKRIVINFMAMISLPLVHFHCRDE